MNPADFKRRTRYPILARVTMVAFIAIKTGRDAVFFQDSGLNELPLAYAYIAIASLPAAMMHLSAMARWDAATSAGLFVIAALILSPFTVLLESGYSALALVFFVIVPTVLPPSSPQHGC